MKKFDIKYELKLSDAFYFYLAQIKKQLIYVSIFLLIYLVVTLYMNILLFFAVICIFFILIYLIGFLSIFLQFKSQTEGKEIELELNEISLCAKIKGFEQKAELDALYKFAEFGKIFAFYLSKYTAIIIPKRYLNEKQIIELSKLVNERNSK